MLILGLSNLGILSLAALVVLAVGLGGTAPRNRVLQSSILGLAFGLVAVAVIEVPITLPYYEAKFDTRAGPAVLAGFFGGPIAGIITGVMAAAARLNAGGDMVIGGTLSPLIYATVGTLAGEWLRRRGKVQASPRFLLGLTVIATIAVLPCFFIGTTIDRGLSILQKAGHLFVIGNVTGIMILGLVCEYVRRHHRRASEVSQQLVTSDIAREAGGIGVWTYNFATEKLSWDTRMMALYGLPEDAERPQSLAEFNSHVLPEDLQPLMDRWQQAMAGNGGFHDSFRIKRPDGKIRHLSVDCRFVEEDDQIIAIGVNRDITDPVTMAQQLQQERDRAEQANAAKTRFMANMSHELRTPLNAILGYTQLVRMDRNGRHDRTQIAEFMNHIHDSGEHLLAMITDLLDLVRIQEDRVQLKPEATDLQTAIDQALAAVDPMAAKRSISLAKSVPDQLPMISMDRKAGHQIMLNLLSNAIKYSDPDTAIEVSVTAGTDHVEVAVQDQGHGIPDEVLEKIGAPLESPHEHYESSSFSAGLGLSITKMLIERMGGTLRFETAEGQGTRAIFSLQLAGQEQAQEDQGDTTSNADEFAA